MLIQMILQGFSCSNQLLSHSSGAEDTIHSLLIMPFDVYVGPQGFNWWQPSYYVTIM